MSAPTLDVKSLFGQALEISVPEERSAVLWAGLLTKAFITSGSLWSGLLTVPQHSFPHLDWSSITMGLVFCI